MPSTTFAFPAYAPPAPTAGLAALVRARAAARPAHSAFVLPGADGVAAETVTYGALVERADAYAAGLRADGHAPGARVLLLASPTWDLYALALAVLAEGLTLTLVDGQATPRRLYDALAAAAPRVVVGSASALRWWPLIGALRRARRYVTGGSVPGARRLATLAAPPAGAIEAPSSDAPALASFTSGSTGAPKAVIRTHAVLAAQHAALAAAFPVDADDVNLPGFPMAVLHNLCSGTTTMLPPADLRATATSDAARVLAVVRASRVTSLSGAPAFVRALARQALRADAPLALVRHVVLGGGPVGAALGRLVRRAFPNATIDVVYGATEAEPICSVSIEELIASSGSGLLVGRPRVELRIADDGEILVRGAHVIGDGWHRTGDRGRIDDLGRVWLMGRAGASGPITEPYAIEGEALAVDGVAEAGFVAHRGAPEGELALAVDDAADADATVHAVIARLNGAGIAAPRIRLLAELPMDARHASKVRRDALARLLERSAR